MTGISINIVTMVEYALKLPYKSLWYCDDVAALLTRVTAHDQYNSFVIIVVQLEFQKVLKNVK